MAAAGHSAVKGRQFRFASPLGNDPDRNFSTCEPNKTLFRLLGSSFLHVNSPLHFLRYVYSVLYCTMLFVCLFVFRVYDIGIDVRFGQGRYRDTRIVTLATRYQLENRTQHTLAFSQRHFVREQVCVCKSSSLILYLR